ncbi:MAG TPA: hypothetical protein ENJ79_04960 [Gammaproteobacteria bacterium]|nr:hypothetical protein [Gammaproteobacteria bacterium]
MATVGFFRKFRIGMLLVVLFLVATNSYLTRLRATDWREPLWMVIYPVNGDGSEASRHEIDRLQTDEFADIERFFAQELGRWGGQLPDPVTVKLAPPVHALPPLPPPGGGPLAIMWWSLKLRLWALGHDSFTGPEPDVRMYVLYHDPEAHARLPHSLGLQKGMIGVVHAFAGPREARRNQVVIAHEFLHTVGASDKYDPATNLPRYPEGFGEPDRRPRFPQRYAEIMGGRILLSVDRAVMPDSLQQCRVGGQTAREIRWID